MKAVKNVLYNFDTFTVDVAEGRLWRDNQLIALTPKAFDTLLVLLAHRHLPFARFQPAALLAAPSTIRLPAAEPG